MAGRCRPVLPEQANAALLKPATAFHPDLLLLENIATPRLREQIQGGAIQHVLEDAV